MRRAARARRRVVHPDWLIVRDHPTRFLGARCSLLFSSGNVACWPRAEQRVSRQNAIDRTLLAVPFVTDRPLITYIRVSTSQQGRSGLGIEVQRQTLTQFAQAEGFTATREFVEVETGKENGGGAKSMVLGQPMLAYP